MERTLRRLVPVLAAEGLCLAIARDGETEALTHGPGERRLTAAMHPIRRSTFLAGRCAARRALRQAGLPVTEIGYLAGGRRPAFPHGSVGSLAHCGGVAVAVVAQARRYRALGCDLELCPLPLETARLLLGPPERDWLGKASDPGTAEGRLLALFSAKEAAFKAFHTLLAADAPTLLRGIAVRPVRGGFRAVPEHLPAGPVLFVRLRAVCPGGVFSWAVLEAP
ncbi:4'-phosphopantetheinyl transferase superfamily protein [Kitasatospora kifunensis]|uniref:4'-phosphopantetheinyl transferase EntD n=1 Tax=Kitasatospora kifunensis TaxID=58351 RepID=A0A7W7VZ61_KITKI|nr:4'-phosphopantetheinyl transferase superfamily protein [Kitasatospora kifunensis]MBB4928231.1 4'-phosphopantetheinyl transferase EntD [Kitasatospora kifunensis]